MKVVYHNLGQCFGDRVVYIRSTDIEQKNWHRLLWSIPDEWFYMWAMGVDVELRDLTSNSNGGKIKRIFAPVVKDLLATLYGLGQPTSHTLRYHYHAALKAIQDDTSLKTKIMYWANKISSIRLSVEAEHVEKEPNTINLLVKEKRYYV